MLEESIIKSNYVGRDGFRWWIGQIAPEKCQGDQINQTGDAWGNRIKVRIMGYHPQDPIELPDDELPWAQILLPSTAGSGGAGVFHSTRLSPGDSVFGFFLDGDDAQLPVILGIFGRPASPAPLGPYTQPFKPYTGYTSENPPSTYFLNREVGSQEGAKSTPLPLDIPEDIAKKVNIKKLNTLLSKFGEEIGELKFEQEKIKSAFTCIGSIADVPDANISTMQLCSTQIKTEMQNAAKDLKILTESIDKEALKSQIGAVFGGVDTEEFKAKAKEIKGIVEIKIKERKANMKKQITLLGGGIAKDVFSNVQNKLAETTNQGLKKVYDVEFAKEFAKTKSRAKAKIKGIAEQASFIPNLKSFNEGVPCILQNILGGLGDAVDGIIDQLFDNVSNFTECIMDQAIAGITNQIIGGIVKGIAPLLGGLSGLLPGGGLDIGGFLRGKAENLQAIASMFECQDSPKLDGITKLTIGGGPKFSIDSVIDNILAVANTADSLTEGIIDAAQGLSIAGGGLGVFDFMNPSVSVPGFKSPLGECYSGPKLSCAGVKLNIFGGGGVGANARAIFGDVIGSGVEAVGSIIGIDLKSGGSGYNAAPYIEIVDDCDQGYGATARAIIDPDPESPTYQEVVDIVILTPGENYPVKDDQKPVIVDHVSVIKPGEEYDKDDKVIDSAGNEYSVIVDDFGRIVSVTIPPSSSVNVAEIIEFPELTVQTKTGFGAILRAQLKPRPEYQGEVKQVIDCIG